MHNFTVVRKTTMLQLATYVYVHYFCLWWGLPSICVPFQCICNNQGYPSLLMDRENVALDSKRCFWFLRVGTILERILLETWNNQGFSWLMMDRDNVAWTTSVVLDTWGSRGSGRTGRIWRLHWGVIVLCLEIRIQQIVLDLDVKWRIYAWMNEGRYMMF